METNDIDKEHIQYKDILQLGDKLCDRWAIISYEITLKIKTSLNRFKKF